MNVGGRERGQLDTDRVDEGEGRHGGGGEGFGNGWSKMTSVVQMSRRFAKVRSSAR